MSEIAMEKVELNYQSSTATRGGLAKSAFVIGTIGLITSFILVGIVPGIAAIILGAVAQRRIVREPALYYGLGFAKAGIWLGIASCVVPMGIVVLMPSCGRGGLSTRSACAANLRGIMQSMNVYAADNSDTYPLLPFAPYGVANSESSLAAVAATQPDDAIKSEYTPTAPQNGSVLASAWLLVLKNYCSPKQFICKSDPFVGPTAAELVSTSNNWHTNFQKSDQFSYAFAYPYNPDGTTGNWWKNTTDSSLPIACDIPPQNGTGKPPHNVSPAALPADPHSWNSPNHEFDGQNIGFADGHAEFARRPDIGQHNDNLFTSSGIKDVAQFGGTQPTKSPVNILTDKPPYDIAVVPARNLDTGGI